MPGMSRRRRGRGFEYLDGSGRRISDQDVLDRVRSLAIPPAWKDVWVCVDPGGHLQAVGVDAAGRKQYLYHPDWRARRDQQKFDNMIIFARSLPHVRRSVERDLRPLALGRRQVLGCAVRLLDRGFFRIGSEAYAEENGTFGLATLRRRHVSVRGDIMTFDYVSKGGQRRVQSLDDPVAARLIARLKRRRAGGPKLLAYKAKGRWVDVRSDDINDYLKEVAGDSFTAKDFRTWNATVLAAVAIATQPPATSKTAAKRATASAVKAVAHHLGNTPAVCRTSYIDPRVFDRYREGVTIAETVADVTDQDLDDLPRFQGAVEEAVLELLGGDADAAAA